MSAATSAPTLSGRVRGHLRGVRLARPIALLLAAAVAALSALVLVAAPAQACSCESAGLKKLTTEADLVYTGVLERASTVESDEERDQFLVRAQRVFKGELPSARFVVSNQLGGSCGFGPVEEGSRWLFLTNTDNTTTLCSGTRPLASRDLARVQELLGVGQRVPAPDPQAAVRMKVEEEEPEGFLRLAAPGAAAVLLGLLGLAVVGRLNRN